MINSGEGRSCTPSSNSAREVKVPFFAGTALKSNLSYFNEEEYSELTLLIKQFPIL